VQNIVSGLNEISRLVKDAGEVEKIQGAIGSVRMAIKQSGVGAGSPRPGAETAPLRELDKELSIWQSKLSVILKEPVGRQGMAKHAEFWAEKLSHCEER